MDKCKYELRDGYYIFEDFNLGESEKDLQKCNNDHIDVNKIREERNYLIKKAYEYFGHEDFMKLIYVLGHCVEYYFPKDDYKDSCDYHHCCECWEKQIRELKNKTKGETPRLRKGHGRLLNITDEVFSQEHNMSRKV